MILGRFRLDPISNRLIGATGEAVLTPLASRFLQTLAESPDQIVTRHSLVRDLWGDDWIAGDPGLNRVVSEARRALGDDARTPEVIQTIPRQGYRLLSHSAPTAVRSIVRLPALGIFRIWLLALITFVVVTGGTVTILIFLADALRAGR